VTSGSTALRLRRAEAYPAGWSYQPDETPHELTTGHLTQIQDTLQAHDLKPDRYVLPQVIITPVG
jgi:hypothetical protein